MSLQFYFGPSGAGKSRQLYEEITRRAGENPRRNFFIIVPDQFTMQTQKELVLLNDRGGIMNIDVLSFGRLSHRILEEVGGQDIPVLDDTGKSLVLQKVAAGLRDELPTLGSFLRRQGYIHEVKSALSEFMQYGISPEDVTKLIEYSQKRGALTRKLKDLQTLYKGFTDYIRGNFITTEETLDVLCRCLHKSKLLPGSVVAFDGFTGFTPIQTRVIAELMRLCGEVIVTLTLGAGEDPDRQDGEQNLFYLSKKTATDLGRLAAENGVERGKDIFLSRNYRFSDAPALSYLENSLFRYGIPPYEREQREIRMFETTTAKEEVRQTGLEIHRLIREEKAAFRDIAVIMGDPEEYAPYVETEFARMEIPCYIDRTGRIALNPVTEYIRSALELHLKNFSYEAVFHYLRSGMADLTPEETDRLENYCLQTGIKGYRAYSRLFTRKTPDMGEDEEALAELNVLRERMMAQVEMLRLKEGEPVKAYVNGLYDFLVENRVQQKAEGFKVRFEEAGDPVRAGEYGQIFRLVMELLDQIYVLLGEETISLREFSEILEAGFGEIRVGTIPQNVDRVLVGDVERTRLQQVKVLFFLGVNDGNIPKTSSKGGIISDMDREFLRESGLELAPGPRQQMYIQRFYLYLNMTKPSRRLYLSRCKVTGAGKSVRPSYLTDVVKKLFPALAVEYPEQRGAAEQIVNGSEGAGYLAEGLREYAEGALPVEKEKDFFTIYRVYGEGELKKKRDFLTEAAFKRYRDTGLSAAVARALYGVRLENSVTRLETYAACAYGHFLKYGLELKERREFSFESVDMGNVYHEVLKQFAEKLKESGHTWFDFPEDFAERCVREALESSAAVYGNTVLYSTAKNEYAIGRMGRILLRTVLTLQKQLRRGSFVPEAFELSFRQRERTESAVFALSERESMSLQGRIDRIDVAEDGDRVYVKVIDYKSGHKKFDLTALYYGLQLQLTVYMNVAAEMEKKRHQDKEIVPAALLYYHMDDPFVEMKKELTAEEIEEEIGRQLRMSGVVNSAPEVVTLLDKGMGSRSDVIPVERKKDGSLSARSSVLSGDELKTVSSYVSRKITEIGREILSGKISLNPYEKGNEEACTYCVYKKVCGFEPAMPDCTKRKLEEPGRDEVLRRMKEALKGQEESGRPEAAGEE